MNRPFAFLVVAITSSTLLITACGQAAPAPSPTKPPGEAAKAAEPTRAPAQPTAAPAQPTAAPAKKVDFPQKGKTISLIMPFAAGGATDLAGRLLASQMEKELGTPMEVVNKTGAAGQVGITEMVQAKPDGYTIAATAYPTVIVFYQDPERKAVFDGKSFQHLAGHVVDPVVVTVKADSPFKSMKDLIDAGKANPEKVKVAVIGILQTNHLALLELERMTGAKFATVFSGGGPQGIQALLGGHVDVDVMQLSGYVDLLKSGQVRILGVADKQASRFAPTVPTMESQGYKVYYMAYRGYAAPTGTPKEIVDILAGTLKKVISSDEHLKKMQEMNQDVRYAGPEEFAKLWAEAEAQTKPLVELARADLKKQ